MVLGDHPILIPAHHVQMRCHAYPGAQALRNIEKWQKKFKTKRRFGKESEKTKAKRRGHASMVKEKRGGEEAKKDRRRHEEMMRRKF